MSAQPPSKPPFKKRRSPDEAMLDAPELAGRVPPHDLVAEAALLGACITDGGRDTMTLCVDARLAAEGFYKPAHQMIFKVMMDLYGDGKPFDEIILAEQLRRRSYRRYP